MNEQLLNTKFNEKNDAKLEAEIATLMEQPVEYSSSIEDIKINNPTVQQLFKSDLFPETKKLLLLQQAESLSDILDKVKILEDYDCKLSGYTFNKESKNYSDNYGKIISYDKDGHEERITALNYLCKELANKDPKDDTTPGYTKINNGLSILTLLQPYADKNILEELKTRLSTMESQIGDGYYTHVLEKNLEV